MLAHPAPSIDVPNLATIPASVNDRRAAVCVAVLLCALAIAAFPLRNAPGPHIPATVAIDQSLMGAAYLLTAYLLFSQFVSSGLPALAAVGAGCAYVGLMQIPLLVLFPDLFMPGHLIGHPGSVAWVGSAFHTLYPVIVAGPVAFDRGTKTTVDERARRLIVRLTMALVILVVALVFVAGVARALPIIYDQDRFRSAFIALAVAGVVANLGASLVCVVYARLRTMLQTWLAVGLLGMGLDTLCYAISGSPFTQSWYISKGIGLITALIVLLILLRQVSALYRRVTELATTDQLTGLPNRRSLEAQLDWLVHYGERHGMSLAVVMVDVDRFKNYNDTYGHTSGDEVLNHVANSLRTNVLRASDMVARYGGEEFVALLPDATREGTVLAVERMRLAVERLAIPHAGGLKERVTISAGAAVGTIGELGPRELLRAADEALYTAKADGRNRTVVVSCSPKPAGRQYSLIDAT
jgi:diguanylate cyclase (GGDEF)-like protein